MLSTQGDTDHWEITILVSDPKSPSEVIDVLSSRIKANTSHMRGSVTIEEPGKRASSSSQLRWTFYDSRGSRWQAIANAEASPEQKNKSTLPLKVKALKKPIA